MPDPLRLLNTLSKATEYFRSTTRRKGGMIHLTHADDILVAGDLHGHIENFRQILEKANLAVNLRRHLVLQEVIHGPYVYPGGGDKSHQLLDLIAALKCQFPERVHYLIGNHELSQFTNRRIAKNDLDLNEHFRLGVENAYGPQGQTIYDAYLALMAAAPLAVRTPNRVFISHSLPSSMSQTPNFLGQLENEERTEGDYLPGGCVHALVWGRDATEPNARAFLRLVDADWLVTGHIPCDRGYAEPNGVQVILDCLGAVAGYALIPLGKRLTHDTLRASVALL